MVPCNADLVSLVYAARVAPIYQRMVDSYLRDRESESIAVVLAGSNISALMLAGQEVSQELTRRGQSEIKVELIPINGEGLPNRKDSQYVMSLDFFIGEVFAEERRKEEMRMGSPK